MKKMLTTDKQNRESILFLGKGSIILFIILISSVSFTLGYLVGRNMGNTPSEQTFLYPVPEETVPVRSENSGAMNGPLSPGATLLPDSSEQSAEPIGQPETVQPPREPQKNDKRSRTLTVQKQVVHSKPVLKTEQKKTGQTVRYTVQIGAFKNAADAEALKESFEKKGYSAYVSLSEAKNNETIYKVRIGNFSTRQQADGLSARIKNSEGLNAFVTFR